MPSASSTGQLIYRISVEDHAGNIEYFQILQSYSRVPSEAPNSARSDYTYNDLIENMESVGLGDPEIIDKINVLANDHAGKWGGALGSLPQLTYSITDAGALTYSDVQLGEYSLYDLHTTALLVLH